MDWTGRKTHYSFPYHFQIVHEDVAHSFLKGKAIFFSFLFFFIPIPHPHASPPGYVTIRTYNVSSVTAKKKKKKK